MSNWTNFFFIISGQFLILLAAARIRRFNLSRTLSLLWRCMLLGLPLGFLFDILIGESQSVFYYSSVPQDWIFTTANGAFSYGIALATAWLLPIQLQQHHSKRLRITGALLCILAVTLLFINSYFELPTLGVMFILGFSILLSSEGLAALFGIQGPVCSFVLRRPQPLLTLWLASICIGTLYETLNGMFPLWHWQEAANMSFWLLEIIIVVLGYFILFLPMLILSHLAVRKIAENK